jgi:hypothetical protein
MVEKSLKADAAESHPQHFAWTCAITTLLSAVLLFLVQPIISKIILPWFGGSPAVWTTCMLFFQTVLLAGYGYAHWLVRAFNQSWQMRIHAFMTLAAALTLPITPGMPSVDVEAAPVRSILWLLSVNIGLPFFVISATGPLLQSWFIGVYPGRPPYRLYALSNIGSLAALWLFPLILEPNLNSAQQDLLWSAGFGAYLLFLFVIALVYERLPANPDEVVYPQRAAAKEPVLARDLLVWIGLPALASVLLVSITSQLCQDVPVTPTLLILPLSLYLLTFILAFDSPRWYVRSLWGWLAALSIVTVSVVKYDNTVQSAIVRVCERLRITSTFDLTKYTERIDVQVIIYLVALFCTVMVCIGETTLRKPAAGRLTLFYLVISAGGALGTAIVVMLCPLVFVRYYELNVALSMSFVVAGAVIVTQMQRALDKSNARYLIIGAASVFLATGLIFVIAAQIGEGRSDYDVQVRNFYGIASVRTEHLPSGKRFGRALYNGQINHGYQFWEGPRRHEPNGYYGENSGVNLAFHALRARGEPLRVGVIGLGTGTLAAYGRKGDDFQFYEIDPKIELIARKYFSYLEDSPADVHVRMGDARLYLDKQLQTENQQFDLLVVDAFSGDAIPIHLLTVEAFILYRRHLKPDGILAVHVSNLHLDLAGVAARLAKEVDAHSVLVERDDYGKQTYQASSDWVLVTADESVLADPGIVAFGKLMDDKADEGERWTDGYSSVRKVLQ